MSQENFKRTALLKPETETKLANELLPIWNKKKYTAKQIASMLGFGNEDSTYENLKPYHIYYYRQKFNKGKQKGKRSTRHLKEFKGKFPPHENVGIKKGKDRYKHPPERKMSLPEFEEKLNTTLPETEYTGDWYSTYVCRKRAYLILHYLSPLRRSEIVERKYSDFKLKDGYLVIDLYRKKKYYHTDENGKITDKSEPFELMLLNRPIFNELVKWVTTKRYDKKGNLIERPFNFTGQMGLNYVNDVFGEEIYPHFFRYNWITSAVDETKDPETIIRDIMRDTKLSPQIVVKYIMQGKKLKGTVQNRRYKVWKEKGWI